MNFTPKLDFDKCESGKICQKGSLGRWEAEYYNGSVLKICDQCFRDGQLDIRECRPILSLRKVVCNGD